MRVPVSPFRLLKNPPLAWYTAVSLLCIIFIVIGFLITVSYFQARDDLITQNERLREYTEQNLIDSLTLVEKGLKLYDDSLNDQMEPAFSLYLEAFEDAGSDPERLDLESLRSLIGEELPGRVDLYVINSSGVIIASTVPEVLNLDFKNYPEFYAQITRIREGDEFAADRVVRSVENASEGTVAGVLRKFAFMPTPDHRYLLEMGLMTDRFESERAGLSYLEVADRIQSLNPNIQNIRIFDFNRNLLLERGVTPNMSVDQSLLEETFTGRDTVEKEDTPNETLIRFLFADMRSFSTASDMSLVAEITYSNAFLREKLSEILVFYSLIAILAGGMAVVFSVGISRYLTRPIREIVEDVETIARGELDHPIRKMNAREFGILEESINLMVTRIQHYSEELEKKRAELRIAADIQRMFLPRSLPDVPGFDLAAIAVPAREVGGDFYDLIPMGGTAFDPVIADVAGKGIPAALFMALSRTVVRVSAAGKKDVRDVIRDVNSRIYRDAAPGMFVTLFFGALDSGSGRMSYVNAGHNPPFFLSASHREISLLNPTGMALGVDDEADYTSAEIVFSPGDVLVCYTDGITEAFNERLEPFGEERLMKCILDQTEKSAAGILEEILRQVHDFSGPDIQQDDLTLLVIKRNGEEESPGTHGRS